MLDAIAVGGPLAERNRIGVADNDALRLRDEMRHFAPVHRLAAALEVFGVGRFEVAFDFDPRIDAAPNVVQVDGEHRRHVAVARVAHSDGPYGFASGRVGSRGAEFSLASISIPMRVRFIRRRVAAHTHRQRWARAATTASLAHRAKGHPRMKRVLGLLAGDNGRVRRRGEGGRRLHNLRATPLLLEGARNVMPLRA